MTIYHIEEGCPICGADIRGNDERKFYCRTCNVLFNRKHLDASRLEEAKVMVGVPKEERAG